MGTFYPISMSAFIKVDIDISAPMTERFHPFVNVCDAVVHLGQKIQVIIDGEQQALTHSK